QLFLERVARGLGGALLFGVLEIDARAILRADVVALAHPLRRIVALPEDLQELGIADDLRIEYHEHDFVVPRHASADFAIGRVRRRAAGIADGRAVDAA